MKGKGSVQSITLHTPLPIPLRLDVWPFIAFYASIIYYYLSKPEFHTYILFGAPALVFFHILIFLFQYWITGFRCFVAYRKVKIVNSATVVKVVPVAHKGAPEICPIQRVKIGSDEKLSFTFQKRRFLYDESHGSFRKVEYPTSRSYGSYLKEMPFAVDANAVVAAAERYGTNTFEIPLPTFKELYKEQALAPFFVFQVFCVGLWCLDEYWYYSLFTLAMLLLFEMTVVKSRLRNLTLLREMVQPATQVFTHRGGKWQQVKSDALVPGDIISLARQQGSSETVVPCDAVLLWGGAVVNEALLTGEAVPQMKEPLSGEKPDEALKMRSPAGRVHVLFGGTRVLQQTPPDRSECPIPRPPNGGCIASVLRTGFGTAQGRLMRTILFSQDRVTANSLESFVFIGVLLVFALVASGYVLKVGWADPERVRSKLLLNCVLIITSVVPPELPMELSLAVNTSLMSLVQLAIFCTEPFRIPFAGKVDVCCFDKTGTLTSDKIVLRGIAGVGETLEQLTPAAELSDELQQQIAGCHSLVLLEGNVIGDPMELAALKAMNWHPKGDVSSCRGGRINVVVKHRFHFSSELKRMSSIASVQVGTNSTQLIAVCKGAPETVQKFLAQVPSHYEATYKHFSRRGCRVLAFAAKPLPNDIGEAKDVPRERVESELRFGGFLVFESPMKEHSLASVQQLIRSGHRVVMITGDNTLTACQVARDLTIVTKPTVILTPEEGTLRWRSIEDEPLGEFTSNYAPILAKHDLCVSGDALARLVQMHAFRHSRQLGKFLYHVRVFARTSPEQKELIVTCLKQAGYTTLMCGDGTNDVGALKQAHVGVALLNIDSPAAKAAAAAAANAAAGTAPSGAPVAVPKGIPKGVRSRFGKPSAAASPPPAAPKPAERRVMDIASMKAALEEDGDDSTMVRLGDASIASPFTAKTSSVTSILHIIRQGRCTLVTTLQMFQILALNCLVSAYSLSVLYLQGVKMGDTQATIVGMMIAMCFLFISRSKPLDQLSARRPLPSLFNFYVLFSLLGQFAVHLFSLITVVQMAMEASTDRQKPDTPFQPNLLNTCVFLISSAMQIATFIINYKGHPFKQGLTENRMLLYSLAAPACIVLLITTEIMPDFNAWIECVPFPSAAFRGKMLLIILGDFVVSLIWERLTGLVLKDTRK